MCPGPGEKLTKNDIVEIESLEVHDAPASALAPPPLPVGPVAPAATHADKNAPVVLVVEDDASVRGMIVRALGIAYTVYEAGDGVDALRALEAIAPPACIVSDWMMPRMDGIELVKHVRADKSLKHTAIVFLTAKNGPRDVVTGINAGVRHYLAKPFKMKELMDKVASIVGKR